MPIPFYVVNSFTQQAFNGNPAAVCIMQSPTAPNILQSIAAQNNLSETAFVWPVDNETYDIRWFTPTHEVSLCGHAPLAAAVVLFTTQTKVPQRLRFCTQTEGDLFLENINGTVWMDFPLWEFQPANEHTAMIQDVLGFQPLDIQAGKDLLVVAPNEATVAEFNPCIERIAALPYRGVIITAQASPDSDYDFVSRFFCPQIGIDEDPVTGSTHCMLVPYWAQKLGKNALKAKQLSARGGELQCQLWPTRLKLGGTARLFSSGQIHLTE
ncbi:MAG: PhzF family phenazine biosynthesis isomerase [Vampirovibrionales bacterium]|nr:PhzF family phenazine biosynthesis isomerase [Vampirovibrionales bacterium]